MPGMVSCTKDNKRYAGGVHRSTLAHLSCSVWPGTTGCDRGLSLQVQCGQCKLWVQKKRCDGHRVCWTCRKANKAAAAVEASISIEQTRAPRLPRPYEQCQRTERYQRRKRGHEALAAIGVPVGALKKRKLDAAPIELVHLSTAIRRLVKTLLSIRTPGERAIAAAKRTLAQTHGTGTATFAHGSYVTDPIKLVRMATVGRTHLVVGGDGGGGFLKLGATFVSDRGVAKFLCLLVANCSEKHTDLKRLNTPGLTPMTGESVGFENMWAVLQHLITIEGAYLHGDWKFLSCVLSHMGATSNYPCFLCTIPSNHLLSSTYSLRKPSSHPTDMNGMYKRAPLLTCVPTRIVPLPLHVFLGIGNRIVDKLYLPTFGRISLTSVLKTVKTVHAPGNGGLSDIHGLNGNELKKWLRYKCDAQLFATKPNLSDADRVRLQRAAHWLTQLSKFLLDSKRWELTEIFVFKHLVDEIQQQWRTTTRDHPFPKLHMLRHCYEFMKRHRILGRVSESEMESFHGQFNRLYHHNHRNLTKKPQERIRRTHADTALRVVQPVAQQEMQTRAKALNASPVRMTRAHSI